MSCNLTQNVPTDCRDSVGGIKELKLRVHPSVDDVVLTSGNVLSSITTSGWYKYQFRPETADSKETETSSDANGTVYYDQSVDVMINKLQTSLRNEFRVLALNRVDIILLDRNGRSWLFGYKNGLEKSGTSATGKAMGDANGYTLSFKGKEEIPMIEVSSTIYGTLTA